MAEPARPRRLTHYELHVLHGERWLIDGTAIDPRALLEEARQLLQQPGVYGVRVLKETYDPVRELTAGRVIFQQLKPRPAQSRLRIIPQARHEPPPVEPRPDPVPRHRVAAARRTDGWSLASALSLAGSALAVLLLIGLALSQ